MVDPGGDVDHEPVRQNALGHRLPADKSSMSGGDVESGGIHEVSEAELAKHGLPRADPILNIHGVRLYGLARFPPLGPL